MPDVRPLWLAGHPDMGAAAADVLHPYDGSLVGRFALPSAEQVEQAASDVFPL